MPHPKIILRLLGVLFLLLIIPQSSSLFAETEISISENKQSFISFLGHQTVEKMYDSGELSITVDSQYSIRLVKEGKKLVFDVPASHSIATGSLIISYKEITRNIDFIVDIPSSSISLDFDIYQQMYKHHLQERALSCESSAASDIISTILGNNVSETEVIERLPKSDYFGKESNKTTTPYTWGNPNSGFVGHIDNAPGVIAKQKLLTGYGVYEKPIAHVYASYGIKTQILNNEIHYSDFGPEEHLTYLLTELSHGNMVQLWGDWCTVWKYDDGQLTSREMTTKIATSGVNGKNECYNVLEDRSLLWKSVDADGKILSHRGLDGQHAFVLLGWKGQVSSPSHIRVWDTNTGYHEYETPEWMRKWKAMNYRSLLVFAK